MVSCGPAWPPNGWRSRTGNSGFRRLLERYRQEGPSGPVSRQRGRPNNNRMPADREAVVLGLIRQHYADFGPTLACEKLRERHGLTLSKESIRRLMVSARLWVPRKQRPHKVYQPRNRRACPGESHFFPGKPQRYRIAERPLCQLVGLRD
ncbi:helix-turn-helix domain-containing protein [Cupriavidus sp. CuC1]|uniref:helix-turn-helix domain-containing protein n=1 Tax=Cupriavidus sp. CuC1 TaxID=3373131 RepID=UPI0037D1B23F